MIKLPQWDQALINKYNVSGPRYTSYPTALSLNEGYDKHDLISAVESSQSRALSLYVHIPFCSQLCYYCGCNKIITRHQSKADTYIDFLAKEIAAQAPLFKHYSVEQLHLGGGTPTFLTPQQMKRLITLLEQHFNFTSTTERGIEVDPRSLAENMLVDLRMLGFNRVSFGIQDFNDDVQLAVNRPQHADTVKQLITQARELGFKSINADMIYGLPLQTPESFKQTIEQLIELSPDRVSVFNYAHLPERFAAQRKIKEHDLPNAHDKLTMFKNTLEQMTQAGYQFIGMDHFAKADNELAIAQNEGKLHRNFQGYTTHGNCDLLGLGASSISQIGTAILQNKKELKHYYHSIETQSGCALSKGMHLTHDDVIRADAIKQLICQFELNIDEFAKKYHIEFDTYFAEALVSLKPLIDDNMVIIENNHVSVTSRGNLFIRIICMCFDAHLQNKINATRFSRVI
ncbi:MULTISPECIES: oxygen-independent coproporphyrinogen III oxidase [unclassified Pseudoalteromonas]|jgi:oxygen-independent coproporphyrinogen-3 oxidase|uniref:oxygen-independent coproporphyrinogen III oxidase n=1 Tax=Pseudoalteromonas sp. S554 TaxID=2066516 RepID=UPI00023154F5|nr:MULTISPECIES: oxygen-independent coproporphyrinogen III oxidase [unclassified Pseudoalteromonas]TMS80426.1 oxygen-independent coproporphyrinogen III oxidase [Pseudoalteromonas sp. S554]GAA77482.1 oxygen-independent coproporphyrinogen-III oxidase [Pseudoalteromonas sp. BSi20480]|tara:strand:- start:9273 stop:10646 length:1374 start_codon:yes stop_codon:yes gene_type:complete